MQNVEVIFVDESDAKATPLGIKGRGGIGIVSMAAAIANAISDATGRRVCEVPIALNELVT